MPSGLLSTAESLITHCLRTARATDSRGIALRITDSSLMINFSGRDLRVLLRHNLTAVPDPFSTTASIDVVLAREAFMDVIAFMAKSASRSGWPPELEVGHEPSDRVVHFRSGTTTYVFPIAPEPPSPNCDRELAAILAAPLVPVTGHYSRTGLELLQALVGPGQPALFEPQHGLQDATGHTRSHHPRSPAIFVSDHIVVLLDPETDA